MELTQRYIARITVEADTPIAVGSGEKGIIVDRLIAKDANGLPYIPGTSLTGVLRHSFPKDAWVDDIFGSGGENGKGSRLILSSAHLIGEDGKTVIEGLQNIDLNSGFYSYFSRLPERDHVRMTDKGAADTKGHGKFDEELVHKGARFVFELELIGNQGDSANWGKLLDAISSPAFRIGAGTRKGFGKLKIITDQSNTRVYDLAQGDLKDYLAKSSSLNYPLDDKWKDVSLNNSDVKMTGWESYEINLKAKDFFLFSAGFGDEDADNKSKTEKYFTWDSGKPELKENQDYLLIPATSIKGALAHRTAFHYNHLKGMTIDQAGAINFSTDLKMEEVLSKLIKDFDLDTLPNDSNAAEWNQMKEKLESLDINYGGLFENFQSDLNEEIDGMKDGTLPVSENNEAVKQLFGFAKNSEGKKDGLRGRVIMDDIYLPFNKEKEKVFNHTKIDRFTNGTIDGALFQEKAYKTDEIIPLKIWVEQKAFDGVNGNEIKQAFEKTLRDLKSGQLSLGGNSAKGHGIFEEAKN